jgi:hypothetical protein
MSFLDPFLFRFRGIKAIFFLSFLLVGVRLLFLLSLLLYKFMFFP